MAGCGADAVFYFHIFNPVLQSQKFDPNGIYIRRWLPELACLNNVGILVPWESDVDPLAFNLFSEAHLSPMEQEFYANNRRVSNFKIKEELGVVLNYPTYKEGLTEIWRTDFAPK